MTKTSPKTAAATQAEPAGDEDDETDMLSATIDNARSGGRAEGVTAGATAAYERISAILADEKVKGRELLALDLAIKSRDMSAADVVAFVEQLPAAAAADAPAATIAERMAGQGAQLALGGPLNQPSAAGSKAEVPKASDIYAQRRAQRGKAAAAA